ncbi:MAG: hypothetical protein LBN06_12085 [Prevotellaceae bacterium]|jgi:hypothetical protein|nr:hypothetical protein [Prevotellaceae bacterium]
MTQQEQVADAMRANGGYATFNQLNKLVDFSGWETKTPEASIRRIVQQSNEFFRIKPGLWALTGSRNEVLSRFELKEPTAKKEETFNHSYYQGFIAEWGNLTKRKTYIPPQDKGKKYVETPLEEIASVESLDKVNGEDEGYAFTYSNLLQSAKSVDVIWFNERKLPNSFFEIEHTTDMQNSLSKFFELQDFYAGFYIVAPLSRKKLFDSKIGKSILKPIQSRVKFISYEDIQQKYESVYGYLALEQLL